MSLAFFLTVRASLRMAPFLPVKPAAISVLRFSAASASLRIALSCRVSGWSATSFSTFSVAPCAAIARPITSASFDSSFVSSATFPPSLLTVGEPLRQTLRQALLAQLGLRLLDGIFDATESRKHAVEVEHEVGGARIAVARLPDRSRIDQPPPGA